MIGVPHPDFGEGVVAVVVPRGRAPTWTRAAVIAALARALASFKVPKRVCSSPSLPRNAMGKVQKNELREQYRASFVGS